MSLEHIVKQLIKAGHTEPPKHRFNPKPSGVIRPGSATQAVLEFLELHPGRIFNRAQVIWHTKRSQKAVDFALLYLRAQGLVEALPDISRNERYLKYRLVIKQQERA